MSHAALDDDDYVTITCGCGHEAGFSKFTIRPVTGPLPNGHFQCPACNRAWTLERKGKAKVYDNGFVVPPNQVVKDIPPVL